MCARSVCAVPRRLSCRPLPEPPEVLVAALSTREREGERGSDAEGDGRGRERASSSGGMASLLSSLRHIAAESFCGSTSRPKQKQRSAIAYACCAIRGVPEA